MTAEFEAVMVAAAGKRIVSFDFFDTLVTRLCAVPDSLLAHAGARLAMRHPACRDFLARRKSAEDRCRAARGWRGDVGIDEIYAEIERDAHWTPAIIEEARELEEALELAAILPRAEVQRLARELKRCGKTLWIVSDSYLPAAFLRRLLERDGMADVFDAIHVSCEHGARKDNGDMWRRLFADPDVTPADVLHIGDNPHSDRQTLIEAIGPVDTILLPPPQEVARAAGLCTAGGSGWRAHLLNGPLQAHAGNSPFAAAGRPIEDPEEFGFIVFGPVLAAFFAWMLTCFAKAQPRRLYFAAREGWFLIRYYEFLRDALDLRTLPPAAYLLISRRAVAMAAQEVAPGAGRIVRAGCFDGSVPEFLAARLGFDLPASALVSQVALPRDAAFVEAVISTLAEPIREQARSEAAALRTYLRDIGCFEDGAAGIVDIGYSATIQSGLQDILGLPLAGYYMFTAKRAEVVRRRDGLAFGCFQDSLFGGSMPEGFMRKTVLLEAFLTSPQGQLSHFRTMPDGRALPVFREGGRSQAHFALLEAMYEGALRYARDLIKLGGRDVFTAVSPARRAAFIGLDAVLDGRLPIGNAIADAMFLEDAFSGNGEIRALPASAD